MPAPKCLVFLAALLLLLPVPARADSTARQVIAKVMQAYGGSDTVEEIHSVCARGRIVAFAFNTQGTYSYCVARDRRLRVDIDYTSFSEHRLLNGRRALVQQGDGASQVLTGGPNFRSVVYQYEQLSLPRSLLNPAVRVRYEGRELLHDDQPVDVLSLQSGGSSLIKIYVDASSGRIVQTSGTIRMGGTQMVLASEYSDFRKVGNTIFPFKFSNYAGGEKIAETSIDSYTLNSELAADTFTIPDAAAE